MNNKNKIKNAVLLSIIILALSFAFSLSLFAFLNYEYTDKKEEIVPVKIIKMEESLKYSEVTLLYDYHPYKVCISHDEYNEIKNLNYDEIAADLVTKYDEYGEIKSKYIKEIYVDFNIDDFEKEEKWNMD